MKDRRGSTWVDRKAEALGGYLPWKGRVYEGLWGTWREFGAEFASFGAEFASFGAGMSNPEEGADGERPKRRKMARDGNGGEDEEGIGADKRWRGGDMGGLAGKKRADYKSRQEKPGR